MIKVGSCLGPSEGHNRPSKGHGGRQHKTIGVAGITAGQGNGVADDIVEGLERAGWRVRQRAKWYVR